MASKHTYFTSSRCFSEIYFHSPVALEKTKKTKTNVSLPKAVISQTPGSEAGVCLKLSFSSTRMKSNHKMGNRNPKTIQSNPATHWEMFDRRHALERDNLANKWERTDLRAGLMNDRWKSSGWDQTL